MLQKDEDEWDLIITPKRHLLDLRLRDVWHYRDLLSLLVKRDIVALYKQTVLGPIWYFVSPLFTTAVYLFIFGSLAGLSTDGLPQPLFYMAGITSWTYFSSTLTATSSVFVSNAGIFGKVYFPRLIMPLSLVVSNLYKYLIQLILLASMTFYYVWNGAEISVSWYLLLFPLMIVLMAAQGIGLGMIVSASTTKYKDVGLLLTFGVQLLMYSTTVVYPLSALSGKLRTLVALNPMTPIMEGTRKSLFGVGAFDFQYLAYAVLVSLLILFIGTVMFNKVEKDFVDTV